MKKPAETTDFFVLPLTLDAMSAAVQLRSAAEHPASQVEATMPHEYCFGKVRSKSDPRSGTHVRPMVVLMRELGIIRGISALAHTVAKLTAPPGSPTSIVWNLE